MASRYKVVGPWTLDESHGVFDVQSADIQDTRSGRHYQEGAKRVVDSRTGKPAKIGKGGTVPFYGEFAWADAARLANDLFFADRYAR